MNAVVERATVDKNGSLTLHNLPPSTDVEVVIIPARVEPALTWKQELELLTADLRRHHPFARMTDDAVIEVLRKTRDEVANERYPDLP